MLLFLLGLVFVILCLFIILVVLIQPSKSGGMGGLGGGAAGTAITESFGATDAERKLANITGITMGAFFVLCFLLTFMGNSRGASPLGTLADDQPAPASVQTVPSAAPAAAAPDAGGEAAPVSE
ncbi:MAG: preprotein translocase subunit SecG [Sumerlaeia bacterium]